MKWLDEHPEIWARLSSASVVNHPEPVKSFNFFELGPSEGSELSDELKSLPILAWMVPFSKLPSRIVEVFEKYGIPDLN